MNQYELNRRSRRDVLKGLVLSSDLGLKGIRFYDDDFQLIRHLNQCQLDLIEDIKILRD